LASIRRRRDSNGLVNVTTGQVVETIYDAFE
jgi:hypothetical protein